MCIIKLYFRDDRHLFYLIQNNIEYKYKNYGLLWTVFYFISTKCIILLLRIARHIIIMGLLNGYYIFLYENRKLL